MTTRIEKIPGTVVGGSGLTINDLPFPRENLKEWVTADSVAVVDAGGHAIINSWLDLHTGTSHSVQTAPAVAELQTINGAKVAVRRTDSAANLWGTGYVMRNAFEAAADCNTIFGVIKGGIAGETTKRVYGVWGAALASAMIAIEEMGAGSHRVIGRRSNGGESTVLTLATPASGWFGLIVQFNYVTKKIRAEIVGGAVYEIDAFADGAGQLTPYAAGVGRLMSSSNAGTGAQGSMAGGIAAFGRITGPALTAPGMDMLRAYLRSKAARLSG